ncbi:MAG: chorismate lyase [Gammaproteobacteria bacterium]|nr:chorismate lyase [Gammaproteobacteria bacterium]
MKFNDKAIREPVWMPRKRLRNTAMPRAYWKCLLDTASLTQRIISNCPDVFSVAVIDQRWGRPMRNEALRLGVPIDRHALIRQVYLKCGSTPWVYARTVIPGSTLTGPEQKLAHLRSRSLGAVLFSDPTMVRDEMEICRLTERERMFARATAPLSKTPHEIWGRRSVFRLHNKPLLVCEVFLPTVGICIP